MNYTVFYRTWWRENPEWPNGLEPEMGEKRWIDDVATEEEARAICQEWNATHSPGKLSRKAEFTKN